MKTRKIRHDLLQKLFDVAVESLDFGSCHLDDEEVEALRACAVVLGLDPMVGTPSSHQCKYLGGHTPDGKAQPFRTRYEGNLLTWQTCARCHRPVEVGRKPIGDDDVDVVWVR